MTAAILTETKKPLQILDDLKIPELRSGQVLVKIHYAGLCHSQLMEAKGFRGEDHFLPHLLGHEAVGTVIKIGNKVKKVQAGDKVVLGWIKGQGLDEGGTIYESATLGNINSGPVTTFSNYSVVSENRVYKKPPFTGFKECILYGCALPTGAGIILNDINPKKNSDLVILGLGGVGLSALMAAKYKTPRSLIAIDVEETKLLLAKKLGATHVFSVNEPNLKKKIAKICFKEGADYVVEAAGKTSTIELGFSLLAPSSGELVFASHPQKGQKISIDPFELILGKKIRGSWGGSCNPDLDIPILDNLARDGALSLKELISREYNLSEINEAFRALEERTITRALIVMP
ncbi:MAG: hypothetical protein CBC19_04085 [Oceanospirillales bacterium TMED59]|nr:MAG: hypothetical protein CBC19_04085 [Oceanospirillales bacterium TMED59]